MNTIDKIRAEIDKWDDSIKDAIGEYADGMRFVLRHFTFVLDTLEEPVSKDLEDCLELNEAAEKFARLYDNGTCDGIAQDCFKAGAEWQKAKMMEGAVEGKVFMSFAPGHNQMVMADVDLPTNIKVKVIIVKEEEQ